ncbi:MAG: ATPase domain-containing protein [Nanoarchaeota archaeon]
MPKKVIKLKSKSIPIKDTTTSRFRTGISELDSVLDGGFPKGSVVLVSGSSGTGKTILALEWLFHGVNKFNENGVYVTFTEPLFKTLKNLEAELSTGVA